MYIKIFITAVHLITLTSEGEHYLPPQNVPLWHKEYLELIIF